MFNLITEGQEIVKQKIKGILKGLTVSFITILMMLLILEGITRLFFPQELVLIRPDIYYSVDNGTGYAHRPNIDTTVNIGEGSVRLITDEQGYRIGEDPQDSSLADIRILALGDSFLEALHVEYDDIMTSLIETDLSTITGQQVQITNTGVAGYNPNHYLSVLRQTPSLETYDIVLVFVYVANDIVSNRVDDIPPRAPTLRHDFRLPDNLSRSELIDAVIYPINDFLEERSHLFIVFKNATDTLLARLGLSGSYFPKSLLSANAGIDDWEITIEILADIANETGELGIPAVFVLLPANIQVDEDEYEWYQTAFNVDAETVGLDLPSSILGTLAESHDLNWFDSLDALRDAYADGEYNLYGHIHKHFTVDGHRVVADFVTPVLVPYIQEDD